MSERKGLMLTRRQLPFGLVGFFGACTALVSGCGTVPKVELTDPSARATEIAGMPTYPTVAVPTGAPTSAEATGCSPNINSHSR